MGKGKRIAWVERCGLFARAGWALHHVRNCRACRTYFSVPRVVEVRK